MKVEEQLLLIDSFLDFIIIIEDMVCEDKDDVKSLSVISLLEHSMMDFKNKIVNSFLDESEEYHRYFIDEMLWALNSIIPIEKSIERNDLLNIKLMNISQLRGHLLKFRDFIVVEKDVVYENQLYIPFKTISLININKQLKEKGLIDKDITVDLAEKYFNSKNYEKQSIGYRKTLRKWS